MIFWGKGPILHAFQKKGFRIKITKNNSLYIYMFRERERERENVKVYIYARKWRDVNDFGFTSLHG